jgi:hypothetical protein
MRRYESSENLKKYIAEFEEVNGYNQIVLFYIKKQIDTQNIKNSLKNQKSKFGARII